MQIEQEIFRNSKVLFETLIAYGFKKEDSFYFYTKNIMNDDFQVQIKIDFI